jgi:hypothetical protein
MIPGSVARGQLLDLRIVCHAPIRIETKLLEMAGADDSLAVARFVCVIGQSQSILEADKI